MILRLSCYRLTGQYFERPRELSSRFGRLLPSWEGSGVGRFMDSDLDPRTSVLRAIGVNAAINFSPALSAPKYGGAHPRFVGSWVAGWYSPVTPGQGTQPPESSYIRRTPTRGPLRPPSNLLTTRRRAEHGSNSASLCNSFRLRGTGSSIEICGPAGSETAGPRPFC